MDSFASFSEGFVSFVWGYGASFLGGIPLLVVFLLLAGLFFTLIYRFPQFRHFKHAIDVTAGKYDKPEDKGEISHFQALCAALSATIGLGNIAGVAVAIAAGGPGAVFWMWLAALVGAATKFSSISLSLIYREVKVEDGETVVNGGPMYTIKQGLGKAFLPLAFFYAVATILSSFGAGNMFQSQSVASLLSSNGGIPPWVTGIVFAALTAAVILGGIKRIGSVAGKLVPTMVVLYFGAAVIIVLMNLGAVPALIKQIFVDAFTGTAAVGGFTGVTIQQVIAQGIRRAVFSNEAGMGTAAMAHAAAKSSPIQEGIVGLLGPYIDTIVVCTVTALVLLITGEWMNAGGTNTGSVLTSTAFSSVLGDVGGWIVTITVIFFAFSTIISWSYYGEKGVTYIFGDGKTGVLVFRILFVVFVFIGAVSKLTPVLNFSDAVFGLLAIPNLICNFLLRGKLDESLKEYESDLKEGKV
ncbi:MAG: sodium:alanine symporter family protein [Bdellovibrionota bacterium]|nr:sodium:alanine symporter family protein [Bdellovibrionota bacterium]MEC8623577.1 sodium:alanine symporter family protein [Bdellovibrionota bacterium]